MSWANGMGEAMPPANHWMGVPPQAPTPEEVGASLVVPPDDRAITSDSVRRAEPPAEDVDLSLYQPVVPPTVARAARTVMVVLAALAALLVVGFGVVLWASGAPDTIRGFFD